MLKDEREALEQISQSVRGLKLEAGEEKDDLTEVSKVQTTLDKQEKKAQTDTKSSESPRKAENGGFKIPLSSRSPKHRLKLGKRSLFDL